MDDDCANSVDATGRMDRSKEAALLDLMETSGYNMVQENGQRRFGGPPPGWEGPPPPHGCEVFVGKIPRDMYEDELVPVFEQAGRIYEFRLMMEFCGENRGYAFVMYTTKEAAQRAIQLLDNFEIRPGKPIGVCVSLDNCRLFIRSVPKDMRKEEILEEMRNVTEGVVDVIVYPSATDKSKNRGFAFVEYDSHKAAALARRKLIPGSFQLWGHSIQVDWAEPEKDVDEETMQRVRVLYVRNLMLSTTEETVRHEFSKFKPGAVERVKKLTDYAFVHFYRRGDAMDALHAMNGKVMDGSVIEVTLAKPVGKDASRRLGLRGAHGLRGPYGEGVLLQGKEEAGNGPLPRPLGSPSRLGGPSVLDVERCVFPFFRGSALLPISMHSLKPSHFCSAVTHLEFYCHKNNWSPPEYYLYSTNGRDGKLLLIYKVVIPSTRSSFMPDKVCSILEDAKEVAAQNALWSLDFTFHGSGSPSGRSPLATGGGSLLPYGLRTCPYPGYPISPPLPLPGSNDQRVYIANPSPFI